MAGWLLAVTLGGFESRRLRVDELREGPTFREVVVCRLCRIPNDRRNHVSGPELGQPVAICGHCGCVSILHTEVWGRYLREPTDFEMREIRVQFLKQMGIDLAAFVLVLRGYRR